jgi:phosphate uptake regulator
LKRLILSKYLAGYQIIKIIDSNSIDFDVRAEVNEFVSNLMGVEILEESNHELILKDLSSLESLNLRQLIERTHFHADNMFATSLESFIEYDKEKAKSVISREPSVDRLYYLVSRQLNAILSDFSYSSYLGLKLVEVLDYNFIIKRLEAIADHAAHTAEMTLELKEALGDKHILDFVQKYGKEVRRRYNQAMKCFYTNDLQCANEIAEEKEDFQNRIQSSFKDLIKLESDHIVRVILLLRSFERISSYSADIAEVVFNRAR